MESPDVELEVTRDPDGLVTGMAYKVSNPGEEGRRPIEFNGMVGAMFESEKLADKALLVNANLSLVTVDDENIGGDGGSESE